MNPSARGEARRRFTIRFPRRPRGLVMGLFLGNLLTAMAFGLQAQSETPAPPGQTSIHQAPPQKSAVPSVTKATTSTLPVAGAEDTPAESQVRRMTFAPCQKLPEVFSGRRPFIPGERLSYDLDLTGAAAGTMSLEAMNPKGGRRTGATQHQAVRLTARSGTFASKFKNASAAFQTTIDLQTLLPSFSSQDISIDGQRFGGETTFSPQENSTNVVVKWKRNNGEPSGTDIWLATAKTLDFLSTFYFFRTVFLKPNDEMCADVMVLRQLWRLEGKVVGREHASTPAGEFDVLHLAGRASRHDKPQDIREIHYWVSDDDFRLPVAVMGVTRQGTLRAVLNGVQRSDLTLTPARPTGLTW